MNGVILWRADTKTAEDDKRLQSQRQTGEECVSLA